MERIRLGTSGEALGVAPDDLIAPGRVRAMHAERSDADIVGHDESGLPR